MDNNSTDGSKAFFNDRFPQVQFIWKDHNAGFAKANNEGVKLAKGEKILFLNPDTILPEDCLEKCLQFFSRQNNIGALGIKMIDGSGNFLPESKRGFPSFFTSFCRMAGVTTLFPQSKIFARYYLGHLPEDKTNEVDVLSGAFMMMNKKTLDSVGGFDEAYFMYAEDIDLSYRLQKAGNKNYYFADSAIIHFKGESVVKKSAAYIRNFYGTMILFIQKHYTGISKTLYILLLKLFIGIKTKFTSKAKPGEAKMPGSLFVLAGAAAFNSNSKNLQNAFTQIKRIENVPEAAAGSAVLFFEPSISFGEMISVMQEYKNQYSFYIHGASSKSIVGSSNKKQPGSSLPL